MPHLFILKGCLKGGLSSFLDVENILSLASILLLALSRLAYCLAGAWSANTPRLYCWKYLALVLVLPRRHTLMHGLSGPVLLYLRRCALLGEL